MAGKVKKGFLYYMLWVAFIVFGIACIFGTVMIFNAGKDVFGMGIVYINDTSFESINQIEIDGTKKFFNDSSVNFKNVKFVSNYTNFYLAKNSTYDKITFEFNKKSNGFVRELDVLEFGLDVSIVEETLVVNVIEPTYWISLAKNVSVTMFCPSNFSFENYNFEFTTKSGQIKLPFGETKELLIKTLNIQTDSGEVYLNEKLGVTSGEIKIETKNSNINVYSNVQNKLEIIADDSKLYVDKINGDLSIKANSISAKCDKTFGNVLFDSKKGFIFINQLGRDFSSGNFTAGSGEDVMSIANVNIEKMTGNVTIPSAKNANIYIGELGGEALIDVTSGSVEIKSASEKMSVRTKSAKISVTQNSKAQTTLISETGSIVADLTNVGNADIFTTRGSITINVSDTPFEFVYSTAGKVKISWITTSLENSGKVVCFTTNDSSPNKITANSEKGNITLKTK